MQCELIFFYSNNTDPNEICKNLIKLPNTYRVITNSYVVDEYLKKEKRNSAILDDIIPDDGPIADQIYKSTKKLHNEYKHNFQDITFRGFDIFRGFGHSLQRQLTLLTKAKKILEDQMDTVFVFDGYFVIYFVIMKLASQLGYDCSIKIGYFHKKNIEYIEVESTHTDSAFKNRFSLIRVIRFIKQSSSNKLSVDKFKMLVRAALRILSLIIRLFTYKFLYVTKNEGEKSILRKIDKKIQRTSSKYNAECALFVTAVREDLYLKPLYPILNVFNRNNKPFQVFTSDLSTSLVLSKEGVQFINLFEEVNILSEWIKSTDEGKRISKKIQEIVLKNKALLGINELSDHLLSQSYRSMAVVIICEHIIKQMKLKSIVAAADGEMLENLSVNISKKYNIPSFSILPGVINPQPILSDWFNVDRIFVHGTQGVEALSVLGYDKKRIIVTGNPKYDYFKTMDSKKSKEFLRTTYHVDSSKKLIVVAMSRWHKDDNLWMSNLIRFCNKNLFEIIIKVHPAYKILSHIVSEKMIRDIAERCKGLRYFVSYDMQLSVLLSASDLVITDHSNAGIEAVLLEKPLISVNFIKEDSHNYPQRVDKYGASIYVEDYAKLENAIIEILNENKHVKELEEGRKEVFKRYSFDNNGNAAGRIYEILMNPNNT